MLNMVDGFSRVRFALTFFWILCRTLSARVLGQITGFQCFLLEKFTYSHSHLCECATPPLKVQVMTLAVSHVR